MIAVNAQGECTADNILIMSGCVSFSLALVSGVGFGVGGLFCSAPCVVVSSSSFSVVGVISHAFDLFALVLYLSLMRCLASSKPSSKSVYYCCWVIAGRRNTSSIELFNLFL